MGPVIAYVFLLFAAGTSIRIGRAHHPIVFVLGWCLLEAFVVTQPLPAWAIYIATATQPTVLVAAAWAAAHSKWRPRFGVLFFCFAAVGTLVAVLSDRAGVFGQGMAYLWFCSSLVGGAALIGSDAPPMTVRVLVVLLFSLTPEAVGWMAWGVGFDAGYDFARLVSSVAYAIVAGIQLRTSTAWRPFWERMTEAIVRKASRTPEPG